MKMMKKITAATLAATLMGTIAVTANAEDAIGSYYNTMLVMGETVSDTIPYVGNQNGIWVSYNNGANYKEYKITIPEDGTLVLVYDANIDKSEISLYRDDTKVAIDGAVISTNTGRDYWGWLEWNSNVGKYAGVIQYKTVKGDHFIRVFRHFYRIDHDDGKLGYGTFNLTAQMKLAGDANNDGKVNAANATAVLKDVVGIEKLSGVAAANADMNDDGKINAADATAILKSIVGLA